MSVGDSGGRCWKERIKNSRSKGKWYESFCLMEREACTRKEEMIETERLDEHENNHEGTGTGRTAIIKTNSQPRCNRCCDRSIPCGTYLMAATFSNSRRHRGRGGAARYETRREDQRNEAVPKSVSRGALRGGLGPAQSRIRATEQNNSRWFLGAFPLRLEDLVAAVGRRVLVPVEAVCDNSVFLPFSSTASLHSAPEPTAGGKRTSQVGANIAEDGFDRCRQRDAP